MSPNLVLPSKHSHANKSKQKVLTPEQRLTPSLVLHTKEIVIARKHTVIGRSGAPRYVRP
jgi:hypothetical protein